MISFVVPIVNNPMLLWRFMEQFNTAGRDRALDVSRLEVVIVDNGSNQLTRKATYFWGGCGYARVLRNETNLGFGPANNQGAKAAKGDVLCFTQTDVEIDSVEAVLGLLESLKDGVLYGPRLIDWDSGWNFGIPYLEGWFLACTQLTWHTLGGFDERYVPADYEDIDLSYTAQQHKISLVALPLPVRHPVMGAAAWNQFPNRLDNTRIQQQRFLDKWFGGRRPTK